jgi:hypothetical protein
MTVNLTNILKAAFSYQSTLRTFYVLTIWVCKFWQKDFGAKAAHKMLVKLTRGTTAVPTTSGASAPVRTAPFAKFEGTYWKKARRESTKTNPAETLLEEQFA